MGEGEGERREGGGSKVAYIVQTVLSTGTNSHSLFFAMTHRAI